jgi:hypothetical protein
MFSEYMREQLVSQLKLGLILSHELESYFQSLFALSKNHYVLYSALKDSFKRDANVATTYERLGIY